MAASYSSLNPFRDLIQYPNSPWICRCGVGHKADEKVCVRCGRDREIWHDKEEDKPEEENVNNVTQPEEA